MRFREILLEWNKTKFLNEWGVKFIEKFVNDDSAPYSYREPLMAAYGADFSGDPKQVKAQRDQKALTALSDILNTIEEKAKQFRVQKYIEWVLRTYTKPMLSNDRGEAWQRGIQRFEDFDRAFEALRILDVVKKKRKQGVRDLEIQQQLENINFDINKYESLEELENVTEPFKEWMSEDKKLEKKLLQSKEAEIILNTDKVKVIKINSKEASCYYGRNTRWCTTSEYSQNHFNWYKNRGRIFIILIKKENKRFQIFFSDDGLDFQVMDERDKRVFLVDLTHSYNLDNFILEYGNLRALSSFLIYGPYDKLESTFLEKLKQTRSTSKLDFFLYSLLTHKPDLKPLIIDKFSQSYKDALSLPTIKVTVTPRIKREAPGFITTLENGIKKLHPNSRNAMNKHLKMIETLYQDVKWKKFTAWYTYIKDLQTFRMSYLVEGTTNKGDLIKLFYDQGLHSQTANAYVIVNDKTGMHKMKMYDFIRGQLGVSPPQPF